MPWQTMTQHKNHTTTFRGPLGFSAPWAGRGGADPAALYFRGDLICCSKNSACRLVCDLYAAGWGSTPLLSIDRPGEAGYEAETPTPRAPMLSGS